MEFNDTGDEVILVEEEITEKEEAARGESGGVGLL